MPTVKQLLAQLKQDHKAVITCTLAEPLSESLNLMIENDFTQVPVVGEDSQFHLVTTQSILKTLHAFGSKIDNPRLTVGQALVSVHKHFEDDDLFEVMKEIERNGAALILDQQNSLKNIITSYDTTLYFRQWSEDTMNVREIEKDIKDIINAAFKKDDGSIDQVTRQAAIDAVASDAKILEGVAQAAIRKYHQESFSSAPVENDVVKSISCDIVKEKLNRKKSFDNLTLDEYIKIFFTKCWPLCFSSLDFNKEDITFIFEGVRKTRNKLAHFHDDKISAQDRSQLKTCHDFLGPAKKKILSAFTESATPSSTNEEPVADNTPEGQPIG